MAAKEEFARRMEEATALTYSGAVTEAIDTYRAALALQPHHPGVLHNLGVLTARLGEHATAVRHFEAALAADPYYVSAHYNRAAALEVLGERNAAIAGFARAAALDPDHYASHRALAFSLLAGGNRGRAMDHFARTHDLRRGDNRLDFSASSMHNANITKLVHDAEQFSHLAQQRPGTAHLERLAEIYRNAARTFSRKSREFSESEADLLGEDFNTAIHMVDAPETAGSAVTLRNDCDTIVAEFKRAGAACFDDLLTPAAFALLRRYLLESTIWHDSDHIDGFVAAYLEDGLACPLLLQVASELRQAFPTLLAELPLSQAWAFKAVAPNAAVGIHADDAAISINFWMTPTEANLEPERGGLQVCRTPPPADWPITDYDRDQERAVPFFEQNRENVLLVPYLANRAVMFESRLIHKSDAPIFRKTYENHRINISLLFGTGLATIAPLGRVRRLFQN